MEQTELCAEVAGLEEGGVVQTFGSQPVSSQVPDAGQRAAGFGVFSAGVLSVYFLLCPGSSMMKQECLLCTALC